MTASPPFDNDTSLPLQMSCVDNPPFGWVILEFDPPSEQGLPGSFLVHPNGFDKYPLRKVPGWHWSGDCWRFPATVTTFETLAAEYGKLLYLAEDAEDWIEPVLGYDPNNHDGSVPYGDILCAVRIGDTIEHRTLSELWDEFEASTQFDDTNVDDEPSGDVNSAEPLDFDALLETARADRATPAAAAAPAPANSESDRLAQPSGPSIDPNLFAQTIVEALMPAVESTVYALLYEAVPKLFADQEQHHDALIELLGEVRAQLTNLATRPSLDAEALTETLAPVIVPILDSALRRGTGTSSRLALDDLQQLQNLVESAVQRAATVNTVTSAADRQTQETAVTAPDNLPPVQATEVISTIEASLELGRELLA